MKARALLLVLFAAIITGVLLGLWHHPDGRVVWTPIAPGVELRICAAPDQGASVRVIALRCQPGRIHVAAGLALEAAGWRARGGAIAAVNGGFFDPTGESLGLRIADGHPSGRLRRTSGAVFFVRHGRAFILPASDFAARRRVLEGIEEAVQCSPRLVAAGKPIRLKPQWARRTGLGIQRDGKVIVAVADDGLSLPAWAAFWAAPDGLYCQDALNLDGGPSTQLSLKSPAHSLEIAGGWPVPDAVLIR